MSAISVSNSRAPARGSAVASLAGAPAFGAEVIEKALVVDVDREGRALLVLRRGAEKLPATRAEERVLRDLKAVLLMR